MNEHVMAHVVRMVADRNLRRQLGYTIDKCVKYKIAPLPLLPTKEFVRRSSRFLMPPTWTLPWHVYYESSRVLVSLSVVLRDREFSVIEPMLFMTVATHITLTRQTRFCTGVQAADGQSRRYKINMVQKTFTLELLDDRPSCDCARFDCNRLTRLYGVVVRDC